MNDLVITHNQQAVTTSLQVAEKFEKEHRNVLRDIESIRNSDVLNFEQMFIEGETPDSYGRARKTYFMNRDGFTLLAMGFTGSKAMKFKTEYIQAFNDMEQKLSSPSSMRLLLEAALEHENKLLAIDTRVVELEDNMRLSGSQEQEINAKGKAKVISSLGGYESNAYKEVSKKVFSQFWGGFKRHFSIPRYGELPVKRYEEALIYINEWSPDTSMRIEINKLNNQQHMKI